MNKTVPKINLILIYLEKVPTHKNTITKIEKIIINPIILDKTEHSKIPSAPREQERLLLKLININKRSVKTDKIRRIIRRYFVSIFFSYFNKRIYINLSV